MIYGMKIRLVLALLCAAPPFLAAQEPSAAAFKGADAYPVPATGVFRVEGCRLEYFGSNAERGLMVFRRTGSTGGIGGNPDIDFLVYDARSGALSRTIQYDLNLEALPERLETKAEWAAAEKRQAEREEKAMKELRALGLADDSRSPAAVPLAGAARALGTEPEPDGVIRKIRYYAWHRESWTLKPCFEYGEAAVLPDSVSYADCFYASGIGVIALRFWRSPFMELDDGSDIYIVLGTAQSAQFLNEAGYSLYVRKDYARAAALFVQALSSDPSHAKAAYNAACCYALQDRPEFALKYLRALAAMKTQDARAYLKKAETDPDLERARKNADFSKGLAEIRKSL